MIEKKITEHILVLGADYRVPSGGISQVLNSYSNIFEQFNFIPTTVSGNKFRKCFCLLYAIIKTIILLLIFKQYTIMHIHGASYNSFYRKRIFIYLAKFFKIKVIYHIHGAEFRSFYYRHKKIVTETLGKCDLIIALSQTWEIFFRKQIGCPHVTVVENVIPYPMKVNHKTDDIYCNLLFLGIIGERKGIFDLLEVIIDNKASYQNQIRLYIGGNGDVEKLKAMIKENNLDEIVKYEGWVSGEKKAYLLSLADIYILPSYNEGSPVSILEAMSYSLPVISTPVGGIPEIISKDINGLLVEPGDKLQIKCAIDTMLSNANLRNKMGEESYRRAMEYFPDKIEKKLLHIYTEYIQA